MSKKRVVLFVLIFFIGIVGCAGQNRNLVVLMPDPNGSTGHIVVSNPSGSVEIDKPYLATHIQDKNSSPSKPVTMDQNQIHAVFADVLAIEPKPPVHFILYFDKNTNTLTASSLSAMPQIIETIAARNSVDIAVIGHTDTVGNRDYNVKLSTRRAEAVCKLLIERGVKPEFLEISSQGKENPLIKTGDNISEPRNRRVEVVVR